MTNGRGNLGYNNFAGGTLRANAAITQGILPSLGTSHNNLTAYLTADNRVMSAYGAWTNTLFGAIDNSAVAGAVSANGALTIDTNGFAVSLAGLTAATGAGLTQGNLSITGGSGYVGAPAVVFSSAGLMPGGTPAAGYAVIDNGQVTGIVITSPAPTSRVPSRPSPSRAAVARAPASPSARSIPPTPPAGSSRPAWARSPSAASTPSRRPSPSTTAPSPSPRAAP